MIFILHVLWCRHSFHSISLGSNFCIKNHTHINNIYSTYVFLLYFPRYIHTNIISTTYSTYIHIIPRTHSTSKNTPIIFNTNYLTEMKLILIIMNYCLLHFDALKFLLGIRLHGVSQPNFYFFNVNTQIF